MKAEVGSLSTRREVDYSQMTDAEKFYKAINDCKLYLGDEKFEEVTESAKIEKPPFSMWAKMLGFMAGIEGYPVTAWYQYIFGFDSTKEVETDA